MRFIELLKQAQEAIQEELGVMANIEVSVFPMYNPGLWGKADKLIGLMADDLNVPKPVAKTSDDGTATWFYVEAAHASGQKLSVTIFK